MTSSMRITFYLLDIIMRFQNCNENTDPGVLSSSTLRDIQWRRGLLSRLNRPLSVNYSFKRNDTLLKTFVRFLPDVVRVRAFHMPNIFNRTIISCVITLITLAAFQEVTISKSLDRINSYFSLGNVFWSTGRTLCPPGSASLSAIEILACIHNSDYRANIALADVALKFCESNTRQSAFHKDNASASRADGVVVLSKFTKWGRYRTYKRNLLITLILCRVIISIFEDISYRAVNNIWKWSANLVYKS